MVRWADIPHPDAPLTAKWLVAMPLGRHYSNPEVRQAIEELQRRLR
jgi:hypothetical protein